MNSSMVSTLDKGKSYAYMYIHMYVHMYCHGKSGNQECLGKHHKEERYFHGHWIKGRKEKASQRPISAIYRGIKVWYSCGEVFFSGRV